MVIGVDERRSSLRPRAPRPIYTLLQMSDELHQVNSELAQRIDSRRREV